MYAFLFTPPTPLRSTFEVPATEPSRPVPAPSCTMLLTVDAASVTMLRQVVMRVCGDTLELMRIEACDHGRRMKVRLCIARSRTGAVMEEVMRHLPGAEFGRFTETPQRCADLRAVRHGPGLQSGLQ